MKLLHLPPKNESNRKRVLACAKRSAWPSSTFFTGTLAFPDTIETIDNTTQTHNPDSPGTGKKQILEERHRVANFFYACSFFCFTD